MDKDSQIQEKELKNDIIEGRNAVIEALRAGRAIDKIFIAKGDVDKTLGHIASKARDKGIVVVEADRRKLDFMSQTHAHQGVVALAAVREYCEIADILAIAAETEKVLETLVRSRPRREVYDADDNYLPAVTDEAYKTAITNVLKNADSYRTAAELTVTLDYVDGRWLINADSALLSALMGGAA